MRRRKKRRKVGMGQRDAGRKWVVGRRKGRQGRQRGWALDGGLWEGPKRPTERFSSRWCPSNPSAKMVLPRVCQPDKAQ